MGLKNIERFAFLFLCGTRDKDLLMGKERMTFVDFERLLYLTDFFELAELNIDIWNRYSCQFKNDLYTLENREQDMDDWMREEELWYRSQWLDEFYKNIPDKEIRNDLQDAEWW